MTLWEQWWPETSARPRTGPVRLVTGAGTTPYGSEALARECDRVREAAQGTRNHTLNTAAFRMGTLVAAHELTLDDARSALWQAGLDAGLPDREVESLLRLDTTGGLVKGQEAPRAVEDLPPLPTPRSFAEGAQEAPEGAGQAQNGEEDTRPSPFTDGAEFVLDLPDGTPAVWGEGDSVLWAEGESLIIAAGNGAGKTTIAGQLVRARLGLASEVLGLPVREGRRILYLAMDRPRQIARSLRRIFTPADREVLGDRLVVWKGPPPADLAKHPDMLTRLADAADADTVIVDSLKDAAVGLSDDEVGAGWNRARQTLIASGREVLELHHNVKRIAGEVAGVNDVYGSAWITSGAGSVILLLGAPGDPIVKFRHVKQPADEVGPFDVVHEGGFSTVADDAPDPLRLLAAQPLTPLTATHIADAVFGDHERGNVEKARRRLDALVRAGHAEVAAHGTRGGTPTTWRITTAGRVHLGLAAATSFEEAELDLGLPAPEEDA